MHGPKVEFRAKGVWVVMGEDCLDDLRIKYVAPPTRDI